MPKKSKTLLEHANELASDLAEKIVPQVESAVETAREKAGPVIAEARDKAAPTVAEARERLTTELLPAITAAVAAAGAATEEVRGETAKRGKAAVAALRGDVEPPAKQTHRFRNFLLILGLGGVATFVARKMSDRPSSSTWESNPTPAPSATGSFATGAHRGDEERAAGVTGDVTSLGTTGGDAEAGTDQGGASPDVAAADAAAEPHEATTPDDPAETVDVKNS